MLTLLLLSNIGTLSRSHINIKCQIDHLSFLLFLLRVSLQLCEPLAQYRLPPVAAMVSNIEVFALRKTAVSTLSIISAKRLHLSRE